MFYVCFRHTSYNNALKLTFICLHNKITSNGLTLSTINWLILVVVKLNTEDINEWNRTCNCSPACHRGRLSFSDTCGSSWSRQAWPRSWGGPQSARPELHLCSGSRFGSQPRSGPWKIMFSNLSKNKAIVQIFLVAICSLGKKL